MRDDAVERLVACRGEAVQKPGEARPYRLRDVRHRPPDPHSGEVDRSITTAVDGTLFRDADGTPRAGERTFWLTDLLPVAGRLAAEAGTENRTAGGRSMPGAGLSRLRQGIGDASAGVRLRRGERAALRATALAVVAAALGLDRDRLSSFERRRRRLAAAVAASVVVALAALSTVAVVGQVREHRAEDVALSQRLAAASRTDTASDPDVAALLAVQAYRTSPTAEASGALLAAASGPLRRVLRGHTAEITSVALDGTVAVTGSVDGTARLWDIRTGEIVRVLEPGCGPVWQVAILADAGPLVTVCRSAVRTWDPSSGAPLRSFTAGADTIRKVASAPGLDLVVVEGEQGVAWLRRPRDGQLLHSLSGHTGRVTAAALTADRRTVATGDEAGNVRLWNTSTGALDTRCSRTCRLRTRSCPGRLPDARGGAW